MDAELSKSEREALKAIYRHSRDGAAAHTGDVAGTLGVTPGTVTATVKRLADRGLVAHRPYHGVSLTDGGERAAADAIRRHRIVERFLADSLGYSWSEADRLAPAFEHELPAEVEHRLYEVLGHPPTCPHGFPIPAPEQHRIPDTPPLYDLEAGDVAEVAVPSSIDPEAVRFLDGLGVRPGARVQVVEKHPFDGPLVLRIDGGDELRTLGERIARRIYVSRIPGGTHGAAPEPGTPAAQPAPTGGVPAARNPAVALPRGGNGATERAKEGTTP